jgi:hypothetical protein
MKLNHLRTEAFHECGGSMSLLAEGLSYTYKVPKSREKRLYDFYLLSLYYGYMFGSSAKNVYRKRIDTLPGIDEDTLKDLEDIVKSGTEELAKEIQEDLLDAMVTAVASEFRHINDANQHQRINEFMENRGVLEQFKKWMRHYKRHSGLSSVLPVWKREGDRPKGSNNEYDAASKAVETSGWSQDNFMQIAADAFFRLDWNKKFGGKAWQNIAEAWQKLHDSKTMGERHIWIDHVFDLEHNTGTMLNKVKRFNEKGGYYWIKKALDAKFSMTPVELAKSSSIPMSIVGRLNRITGVSETVVDHGKRSQPRKARNTSRKKK